MTHSPWSCHIYKTIPITQDLINKLYLLWILLVNRVRISQNTARMHSDICKESYENLCICGNLKCVLHYFLQESSQILAAILLIRIFTTIYFWILNGILTLMKSWYYNELLGLIKWTQNIWPNVMCHLSWSPGIIFLGFDWKRFCNISFMILCALQDNNKRKTYKLYFL